MEEQYEEALNWHKNMTQNKYMYMLLETIDCHTVICMLTIFCGMS